MGNSIIKLNIEISIKDIYNKINELNQNLDNNKTIKNIYNKINELNQNLNK